MTHPDARHSTLLDALPAPQADAVRRLGAAFAEAGHELVLVGGPVRDLLLGSTPPNDLDLATSAIPEQTKALGLAAGAASYFDVGEKFGTIGVVFGGDADSPQVVAEITTYRVEHYPDATRHPAVQLGGHLTDDLARRDFTVNAIAIDITSGDLIDPFDGEGDLHRARLRAVGDPRERFHEDPLRLLRAARFVAQLGFYLDADTAAAMRDCGPELARISKERIYAELTKLLLGPYAGHGLDALVESEIFTIAMPDLHRLAAEAGHARGIAWEKDLWEHTKRVIAQSPPRPIVRWSALIHDAAKPQTRSVDASGEVHFFGHEREGADLARRLLNRLKADKTTVAAVAHIVELHLRPATYAPDWTDSAVRRLMLEAGDVLDDLIDLAAADVTSARESKQRAAATRIAGLRAHIDRLEAETALAELKSPLDGDELMRMFDRPPGRWIAMIKDHLREIVIDGTLAVGDRDTAERIAREMIANGEV